MNIICLISTTNLFTVTKMLLPLELVEIIASYVTREEFVNFVQAVNYPSLRRIYRKRVKILFETDDIETLIMYWLLFQPNTDTKKDNPFLNFAITCLPTLFDSVKINILHNYLRVEGVKFSLTYSSTVQYKDCQYQLEFTTDDKQDSVVQQVDLVRTYKQNRQIIAVQKFNLPAPCCDMISAGRLIYNEMVVVGDDGANLPDYHYEIEWYNVEQNLFRVSVEHDNIKVTIDFISITIYVDNSVKYLLFTDVLQPSLINYIDDVTEINLDYFNIVPNYAARGSHTGKYYNLCAIEFYTA
jgi:hypothetical protein